MKAKMEMSNESEMQRQARLSIAEPKSTLTPKETSMGNSPVWVKIVRIIIAVLTAIIGFFTGAGAQAMTSMIG